MSVTFLSSRELSKRPGRVLRNLKKKGPQVITLNGQPAALMVAISGETIESDLNLLYRLRMSRTLGAAQAEAVTRGVDKLTMKEIDAEVAAARTTRRRHAPLGH